MDSGILFLFKSIHNLFAAEKYLKKRGLDFDLSPVPLNISTSCGMCIMAQKSDLDAMADVFNDREIEFRVFEKEGEVYTEMNCLG